MNWSTVILLALTFVVFVVMGRAIAIHRRLSRAEEERYRQYVADMEAVGRRFRADSADMPLNSDGDDL